MDFNEHSRTIIHIDLDCFYAQVELLKNPSLYNKPIGIQQKNIVVTSNYLAREYGIKKCMFVEEAKKLCPSLTLINGENLHDYRQMSYKVTNLLQTYTNLVERLGLDENFMDVTSLVNERIKNKSNEDLIGHIFGSNSENCGCGCETRLKVCSVLAQEIRDSIKRELGLTSSAGIAHNKLLAKIVGGQFKPDQQCLVLPNSALELILSLRNVQALPGIGKVMYEQLETNNICTIEDLQNCELEKLTKIVGNDTKARFVRDLSFGVDRTTVKTSGKPQSIGLEDSCKSISIEKEVKEKLQQLLNRLLLLVEEDGRVPKTIKLTVRKFNKIQKVHHRETRQCNINTTVPNKETKIMTTIMHLFNKLVNVNKPFHITLLGLAFTKFQELPKNSITSFLKKNIEVQSIISIKNEQNNDIVVSPTTSAISIDNSVELETSPLAKKLKTSNLMAKRRCFSAFDDCASPSKLRVADLCLSEVFCPPNVDKDVFAELPNNVQKEIWEDYRRREREQTIFCGSQIKKPKTNTLFNYFIKN